MSTKAKGDRGELKAKAELESLGYLVERAHAQAVWIGPGRCRSVHHDFFGAWDLIAMNKDQIRFIQVTAGRNVAVKRHKVDHIEDYLTARTGVSYEVWQWIPRTGWRVWVRYGGQCKWVEMPTKC